MPGTYKDEGVVLSSIKLGEADRIVTVYTQDHGKVRAVAKGVRKTKSRFGARLEPFTQARLMFYSGRNLDTITGVDIIRSFDGIRTGYRRLLAASAAAELVEKLTPERERAGAIYGLLVAALQAIRDDASHVAPSFLLKLLSVAGYHPQLVVCAGCGRDEAAVGFSSAAGGVVCSDCWSRTRDAVRMSSGQLDTLFRLLEADLGHPPDVQVTIEMMQALRSYAEYHLERPIKTLHALSR